ncbi:MAG: dTMP kinase [Nanoarchaeota archaeon]|nr:dTMP kinase [Nanoarchaeota archaeon]
MANKKGFYITLSGGEHSGKSSHMKGLQEFLIKKGLECELTREPGGTKIGSQIRGVILNKENGEMASKTELFLYVADRAQQFEEYNVPVLNSSVSIVSDRCFLETEAYQGHGRGLDIDLIKYLNGVAMGGYFPDVSFIIDGDPVEMAKNSARRAGDWDRLDMESVDFHRRVRSGFREISKQYDFCKIIPYIKDGQREMQQMMRGFLAKKLDL